MKNGILKTALGLCFVLSAQVAFAQTAGQDGVNYLTYTIIGVVVLLVLGLVMSVGDNLLSLEAKATGADKTDVNTSIFPRWNEIIRPKLPAHSAGKKVHVLKQGHDILLVGGAENKVGSAKSMRFALKPQDFIGMSPIPKVNVEVGEKVQAGDALFFDKKRPEIIHTSPVSGEVIAINRGEKRSIAEIVILADKEQEHKVFEVPAADADREAIVEYLLQTGGWTMIKQRPFNITPSPTDKPRDIFVSTFDTAPNAPDMNFVVTGREAAFQKGLDVLNTLTTGSVHLGLNAGSEEAPSAAFTQATGVEKHYFHGKHPAGNVGVQIHHIKAMAPSDKVWTLGVQEVITIGELFISGKFDATRYVALTGDQIADNDYAKTYLGANLGELISSKLTEEEGVRFVAGDILTGNAVGKDGFLGYFDDQVTVLEEGDHYEMFGWLLPIAPRPTVSNTFPNFLYPDLKFEPNTNTHGEKRAFVVTGQYEEVLPMDIYPQHVFKSILVNDFERMEGLGTYELVEEDVALCEFVCTSKQPLQHILREGLEYMREQG